MSFSAIGGIHVCKKTRVNKQFNRRKRMRAVHLRLFVGSEELLLSSRKRANNKRAQKNSKRGRGRKKKALGVEASSLPPHSQSPSLDAHNEGGTKQNADLYEEHDGILYFKLGRMRCQNGPHAGTCWILERNWSVFVK